MALKRSAVRDRYAPPLLQAHPFDGLFCLFFAVSAVLIGMLNVQSTQST